jgi:DNA polymerase
MDASRQTIDLADLTAALDWWREAGVDCDFADAPRQWIAAAGQQEEAEAPVDPDSFPAVKAQSPAPPSAPPAPSRAMIGGDPAHWPAELGSFAEWWLNEPSLDGGQVRGRVPPRGPVAAPLLVLVAEPEAGDSDTLLAGPQGKLLAAMLAAMGLREDQVYIASALPRHMPMADWPDLAAQGLGAVLRHHLGLARPQRIIAFGRHFPPLLWPPGLESPLAGNAPTQTPPILPHFSHEGGSVPILVARDLGSLLERPIAKGNFWQHWLEWTAGQ